MRSEDAAVVGVVVTLKLAEPIRANAACDGAGFQIALRGHRVAQFDKDVQLLHMTEYRIV
jgi:hypothetical protein